MTKFYIITSLFLWMSQYANGQVEHNFKMNPENTDCHQLKLTADSAQNIELIRKATFRVKQNIQLSRYHPPNKLEYYSCDGAVGYVIATESKEKILLFTNIKMSLWDSLLNTDDPITFYFEYLKHQ